MPCCHLFILSSYAQNCDRPKTLTVPNPALIREDGECVSEFVQTLNNRALVNKLICLSQ